MRNSPESLALPGGVTITCSIPHAISFSFGGYESDCESNTDCDCDAGCDCEPCYTLAKPERVTCPDCESKPLAYTYPFPDGYPNSSPDRYPDDAA